MFAGLKLAVQMGTISKRGMQMQDRAEHVINACPLYGAPNSESGIEELDMTTRKWMLDKRLQN